LNQEFCESYDLKYTEISTTDDTSLQRAFAMLTHMMMEQVDAPFNNSSPTPPKKEEKCVVM
jgi:hypothetical protein